jgi:hypothetical protein
MKKFNVTYQFSGVVTVSINVPEHFTEKEAIEYAKEHAEDLPLSSSWEYLPGSSIIDEENCDFEE